MPPSPAQRVYGVVALGAVIRLALFSYASLVEHAGTRLELSTPVSAFKSLQEGVFLLRRGSDPYDGYIFRQAPILLVLFNFIPSFLVPFVYTFADVGTALALSGVASTRLQNTKDARLQPWWVAAVCILNPLGILTTLARSTSVFSNSALALALYGAFSGSPLLAMLATSVALHLSMTIILVPAIFLVLADGSNLSLTKTIKRALPLLLIHQATLAAFFYFFLGSWTWLRTYSALYTVQDLTPNIGLHWYFFIEMFDHFRDFFLLVFQMHPVIYAVPVCLKLRFDPVMAFMVLAGIYATFKSYPTLGDTALYHSLLALCPELYPHMKHPLFTIMAHLYTLLILPTFHHLWLYAGSGNSNFYYASTLVWALATGLGVIDTLTAALKRQYLLEEKAAGHEALKDGESVDEDRWAVVQY